MTRSSRTTIALAAVAIAVVLVFGIALLVFQGNSAPTGDLSEAVKAGDADLVRAHLEAGADPDDQGVIGFTPLMRAAIRDDVAIAALLLDAGADLNATAPEGLTAIHMAAQADAAASLDALVAAGADMGATSINGMNGLHHAAALGSVTVIEFIEGHGMDLNVQSEWVTRGHGHPRVRGATALGVAAYAGQLDAVEALLALGAGVDTLSTTGHSPLLLAVFSGYSPEIVSVLLAVGADPRIEASCDLGGCLGEPGDALAWARRLNRHAMVPLLEAALQD